jgi:2,3-bisphosphoglycerate-dependent phosphoglycerate mutase
MRPFYFLRHGESEANRAGVIAGSVDSALTDLGVIQAQQAATLLEDLGIRRIVASPQRRARRTAEIVAETLGLPVATDAGLVERRWGALEGQPVAERTDYFVTPEGGEGWDAFRDRAWTAFEPVAAAGPSPLLIVAHSGIMRVLRDRLGLGFALPPVENALPIRFAPPAGAGLPWTAEPVTKLQS